VWRQRSGSISVQRQRENWRGAESLTATSSNLIRPTVELSACEMD
jgi:hypothetical protein